MNQTFDMVTVDDARPAGNPGECFYCRRKVGEVHTWECVIPQRMVKVRMIVEYDVSVPRSWTKENIEFHRNESSWCKDNAIDEIKKLAGYLCDHATFEYVGEVATWREREQEEG